MTPTCPPAPQQLLNGACKYDWGAQKCFYSVFNCSNVTAASLTEASGPGGGDSMLAASCATQNVTKSLPDLAVYNSSVCTLGRHTAHQCRA
jgi:hypothetical protein